MNLTIWPLLSTVPPPALSVTARAVVTFAVACNVPPFKVSPPAAPPRLASDEIASVPDVIVHGVVAAVVLLSVQVLAPVFSNAAKFRYCAATPISAVSNVALALPPSRRTSLPPLTDTMLPLMVEPDLSSSTLVPPLKVMALACAPPPPALPPVIEPLLMTVRPEPRMPTPPAPAGPGVDAPPPAPPLPPVIAPLLVIVSPEPVMPAPPAPPLLPGPPAAVRAESPPAPPAPPRTVPALSKVTPLAVAAMPLPPLPPPPPAVPVPPVSALPPLPPLPAAMVSAIAVLKVPVPVMTAP